MFVYDQLKFFDVHVCPIYPYQHHYIIVVLLHLLSVALSLASATSF